MKPIKERIKDALREHGGRMRYSDLAIAVFPEEEFPRAWNYSSNGGPPGCYMALSAAIKRHGFKREGDHVQGERPKRGN